MCIFRFQNVLQTGFQDGLNMVVNQTVIDAFPGAAVAHHSHLLEKPQLMGGGGLADAHCLGNFADAFFSVNQLKENLDPGAVRENGLKIGQFLQHGFFRLRPSCLLHGDSPHFPKISEYLLF